MEFIKINNLNYKYPDKQESSVKDINLSLDKEEILLVLGKSGSGKSTLCKALTGAVPYFYGGEISGEVKLYGENIENMPHTVRASNISMVFQDPEKQLLMNKVHREVAFGLSNIGVESKEIRRRVWETLEFIGITHLAFRDIKTLSGGEKQKVALASALAYMPRCIVMDEPTSQLDPVASEDIINLVKKINEDLGITFIVVEQRVDKWFSLADKICYMEDGKIDFLGTKDDFYKKAKNERELFLPDYLRLQKLCKIQDYSLSIKQIRKLFREKSKEFLQTKKSIETKLGETVIEIKNLSSDYEGLSVLKDINFILKKSSILGVMGENGAGKSTLMKCIMNLKDYKGNIKILGKDNKKVSLKDLSKYVAYVSQNPNDYISKDTVYEELKFTLANHGIQDEKYIEDILKNLDIYNIKDQNPKDLSGGQRQRVAIATMLVLKPKVIILDEPTRGLDNKLKEDLGELLLKLKKQGSSIIVITHDMNFNYTYCDELMLLLNGEIVASGTKDEIIKNSIFYSTNINKILGGHMYSLKSVTSSMCGEKL
ncbi:energy-coupling factor transport system ATP-binding protein [Clostridium cavendishii DSM 21758]|uniref:Energy-coupling factor transport system ATP-binding protein n=1 Tax=Clostridium cavendishii DSM 21758 TaxID=1121302 RepID=A0A1M6J0T2_9CLOT|nr:energy-coupling factor transporter ATPase [Clostridium cavendishii]SHJ40249.1 energy-coupling factor transport system ATP-binding protein [Clostridium cavendishii DSM 21758]